MSQIIISVGREFGSGGKEIAEELAKRFDIPFYDRYLINEISEKMGLTPEEVEKYDEKPKMKIFSRRVNGYSNSIEDNIAEMEFNFLRQHAENGDSFVVVGRCAETKLNDFKQLISLFILGDHEEKVKRVMKLYELSEEDAKRFMEKKDKKRKSYHNYHCSGHWGDSRLYDLSINSSCLGIEGTVDMLEKYIRARIEKN
ncbi:AAA family ATPase [Ruminococcus sp. XPD3002]|uniref:cytidylate kinase-like family protein n=1 Tax=Ruminococcus sp. XPD3002 TaxID=1452269 RepID=UPI000919358C|nr:cytidylate kinase-like family protein [Ruminococcus sp.]SFX04114.1 Cytidylate kinase [Ruminococcus flavefaciens]